MTLKSSLLLIMISLFLSCGEEENRYTIPRAKVNLQIDLGGRDRILNGAYSNKIFSQGIVGLPDTPNLPAETYLGYSGILVLNNPSDANLFVAYDICCPYEGQRLIVVLPETSGLTARCQKCSTIYDLLNGGRPKSGVGKERLQQYPVNRVREDIYRVLN